MMSGDPEAQVVRSGFLQKYITCVIVFVALAGIMEIGVGSGVIATVDYHAAIYSTPFRNAPIVLLVGGILTFIGAVIVIVIEVTSTLEIKKTPHIIVLVVILVGALLAFVAGILGFVYFIISTGILTFVLKHPPPPLYWSFFLVMGAMHITLMSMTIEKDLNNAVRQYGETGKFPILQDMDKIQRESKCCGVIDYTDWRRTIYGGNRYDKVPDSCCKEDKNGCGFEFKDADINKQQGCFEVVNDSIRAGLLWTGSVGLIFGILTIIVVAILIYRMKCENQEPPEGYTPGPEPKESGESESSQPPSRDTTRDTRDTSHHRGRGKTSPSSDQPATSYKATSVV